MQIYEDDAQGLDTMVGNDPLEVERRAALLGPANSDGQHAIDELTASVSDLAARRAELRSTRAELTHAQQDLATRRHTLDTELAALELRSATAADRTVLAAQIGHDTRTLLAATATQPAPVATTTTSPTTSTTTRAAHGDAAARHRRGEPAPRRSVPRVHPGAGERRRLQRGELSRATTARTNSRHHLERRPRRTRAGSTSSACCRRVASEYDQDEMAWSLYQWQGNGPWGGRC